MTKVSRIRLVVQVSQARITRTSVNGLSVNFGFVPRNPRRNLTTIDWSGLCDTGMALFLLMFLFVNARKWPKRERERKETPKINQKCRGEAQCPTQQNIDAKHCIALHCFLIITHVPFHWDPQFQIATWQCGANAPRNTQSFPIVASSWPLRAWLFIYLFGEEEKEEERDDTEWISATANDNLAK